MTLVSDALAIARAGIRAVDPARAVARNLRRSAGELRVGGRRLRAIPPDAVHLVAIGKAAAAMADAAAAILGPSARGIVATPRGYPSPRRDLRVVFGEHPVPGPGSFRAGAAVLDYVRSLSPHEAVLFLISGGGSATVEAPAPSLSSAAIRRTTEVLLSSGAPIQAMNAIRRHLSAIKGGRLAFATPAKAFATIAISDVVGDPPADIASGPTVGDPSTFRDALGVVGDYDLVRRLPGTVLAHLRAGARGRIPETPKPTDPRLRGRPFLLGATNRLALDAAEAEACRRGYAVRIASRAMTGETRPVAERFASFVAEISLREPGRRRALLAGGETTVRLGPHPGRGGRNQEFALASAAAIVGLDAVVLSLGTDGVDGPTDAAGGWVDGRTVARAKAHRIDLAAVLRTHSAYDALVGLGGLVRTGPTGTNVMDLHVGLVRGAGAARPTAARAPPARARVRQSGYGGK